MHFIGCSNVGEVVKNGTCNCANAGETVQNGTCACPLNEVVQDDACAGKSNCQCA